MDFTLSSELEPGDLRFDRELWQELAAVDFLGLAVPVAAILSLIGGVDE